MNRLVVVDRRWFSLVVDRVVIDGFWWLNFGTWQKNLWERVCPSSRCSKFENLGGRLTFIQAPESLEESSLLSRPEIIAIGAIRQGHSY